MAKWSLCQRADVAALQLDPEDDMLLHGVREEDLERERQQLARVRLPLLHGPENA